LFGAGHASNQSMGKLSESLSCRSFASHSKDVSKSDVNFCR